MPSSQGITEVKRSLNFTNDPSSQEPTIESLVTQAPNPSLTPKPEKASKTPQRDLSVPCEKPAMNEVTQGYLLPKLDRDRNKKTLVLDLDETIIHSWFKQVPNPDMRIEIKNNVSTIFVMIRPGAQEFLEEMQKYFEICFFTASVSSYALPLISKLEQNGYNYQILCRQHCDIKAKSFVKDLSKIGRELRDVIIIDNTPA